MPDFIKYVIDGAAAIALFFALLCVFVVDFFFIAPRVPGPGENTLKATVIEDKSKYRDPKKLKLAVTPTAEFVDPFSGKKDKWDDMSKLLNELGDGYRHDMLTPQEILLNPQKMSEYDVIFLTCAQGGEELKDHLRNYVANGGILYASDWRYQAVAAAFPDMVAPNLVGQGAKQKLDAEIVDPALREALGSSTIHLNFDLGEWKTAAFSGARAKTLIQGRYEQQKKIGQFKGDFATAPLMVRFTFDKGTVVFTSFHNEKQNSETEKKLMQFLVYSLITAGIDADVNKSFDQGGFAPRSSNLLSTPKRNNTITKTYSNKSQCDLSFALGFRNEGAKLRFQIKSPDNKTFTIDRESTAIVEVPSAMPGTWTYSVTDLHLPYDNFPFTVTVAEKR